MSEELFRYQKELDEITRIDRTKKGWLQKVNEDYSEAEQVWLMYSHKKKSLRAQIENEIFCATTTKITNAELERKARASLKFQEFLEGMSAVCKIYTELKNKKETLLNRIEALRTFISLEKALRNLR